AGAGVKAPLLGAAAAACRDWGRADGEGPRCASGMVDAGARVAAVAAAGAGAGRGAGVVWAGACGAGAGMLCCGTVDLGDMVALISLLPPMAAGLSRGISASGGGGIGLVVNGARASATCAGV